MRIIASSLPGPGGSARPAGPPDLARLSLSDAPSPAAPSAQLCCYRCVTTSDADPSPLDRYVLVGGYSYCLSCVRETMRDTQSPW